MKCANCENDALWVYEPEGANDVAYCDKDLPSFLRPLSKAGLLTTTDSYRAMVDEVATLLTEENVKKTRAKKVAVPTVEEVLDEPMLEEA